MLKREEADFNLMFSLVKRKWNLVRRMFENLEWCEDINCLTQTWEEVQNNDQHKHDKHQINFSSNK